MTEIKPDTPHLAFAEQAESYNLVDHFYRGVKTVREQREEYLPKTKGMIDETDKKKASDRYNAFVMRATFPGIFRHTVSSIVGVSSQKPPETVEVPAKWEAVIDCATPEGDDLRGLHNICVRQLAKFGRVGFLTDLRQDDAETPVVVPYYANQIINWRHTVIKGKRKLSLLVLKKTESVAGQDYWEDTQKEVVEVYELHEGVGVVLRRFEHDHGQDSKGWVEVEVDQPKMARQKETQLVEADGQRSTGFRLPEIPFTPATPFGLHINPVDPPFLDLAMKLKDIYITSANYRESLSMYEPTPVFIGYDPIDVEEGKTPKYLGVGRSVYLPQGGDAKMLEYNGPTISNIRQALIDDAQEAERLATQPFERMTSQAESGESKKERARAKTNVIREIHITTGLAITEALRKAARWLGDNEEAVKYDLSDDLDSSPMAPAELREITSSYLSGILTDQDVHSKLKAGGMTNLDFDEWMVLREGGETGGLPDKVT